MQKYVYSIDDFFEKWELLMRTIERFNTMQDKYFVLESYDTHLAVAILRYYGVNKNKMLAIKLTDLSENGISGINVTFDKKSLDFLLKYKKSDGFERYNGKAVHKLYYIQDTLIRSTRNKDISENSLDDNFNGINAKLPKEDRWLNDLFKKREIETAGMYDRTFTVLQKYNPEINKMNESVIKDLPIKVKEQIYAIYGYTESTKLSTITARLRNYYSEYHSFRMAYEKEKKSKAQIKNDKKLLAEALSIRVSKLKQELDEIQELINFLL